MRDYAKSELQALVAPKSFHRIVIIAAIAILSGSATAGGVMSVPVASIVVPVVTPSATAMARLHESLIGPPAG